MKGRITFSCLALLLLAVSSQGETPVSGEIPSGTWAADGNPYILIDDVSLANGQTLTIEAGVVVLAESLAAFYITNGTLLCEGTPDANILFTSTEDNGGWGGFIILDNPGEVELHHTIIERGRVSEPGRFFGGAFVVRGSSIMMDGCTVRESNSPNDGGGMLIFESSFSITNSRFYGNEAQRFGGALDFYSAWGTFYRNVLYDNYSQAGGAIYVYSGDYEFDHITMYNNNSFEGVKDISNYMGTAFITNSIIWNDITDSPLVDGNTILSFVCLPFPWPLGQNQIHEDPQFVDREHFDLHLLPESPCIDAGNPDSPRDPDGSITDLGALPVFHPAHRPLLAVPAITATAGDSLALPVLFIGHSPTPIISVQCEIVLPMDVIHDFSEVNLVPVGPVDVDSWTMEWSMEGDTLSVAIAGSTPLSGEGPLFVIHTSVLESAEQGEYSIGFESGMFNQGMPEAELDNGVLYIVEYEPGDVSMNGHIQAFDAALLLSWFAEQVDLDPMQQQLGEVSGDGELSPLDVSLILQYVVGSIDEFPIQSGAYYPPGTGTPELPAITYARNDRASFPFVLESVENIYAMRVRLSYDHDVVRLLSVNLPIDSARTVLFYENVKGAVIDYVSRDELSGERMEFFDIEFELTDPIAYDVPIEITSIELNEFNRTDSVGTVVLTRDDDVSEGGIPEEYRLVSVFPNPFNQNTTILLNLNQDYNVNIVVLNTLGRKVESLLNEHLAPGRHRLSWDATRHASGTYYLRVTAGDDMQVLPIVLLR